MSDIWGASIEELDKGYTPDLISLTFFQELALSLVDCAQPSLGDREDASHGLLSSQARWRLKGRPASFEENGRDLNLPICRILVDRGRSPAIETQDLTAARETDHSQEAKVRVSLTGAMHMDQNAQSYNALAVLLMAGFIYGVVISFLIGIFKIFPLPYHNNADSYVQGCKINFQIRTGQLPLHLTSSLLYSAD